MADVLHRDLVPDEHHERLQHVVAALGNDGALAGREADHDQEDAGGDPHVDHVLGDVEAHVALTRPEAERHHRLVLHVLEDVLRDAALVLLAALLVLALVHGARRDLLVSERRPMLAGGRLRRVRNGHAFPVVLRLGLGKKERGDEDDHGKAPGERERAWTKSTSITWVAA